MLEWVLSRTMHTTTLIDLLNREIISYASSETKDAKLIEEALLKANYIFRNSFTFSFLDSFQYLIVTPFIVTYSIEGERF